MTLANSGGVVGIPIHTYKAFILGPKYSINLQYDSAAIRAVKVIVIIRQDQPAAASAPGFLRHQIVRAIQLLHRAFAWQGRFHTFASAGENASCNRVLL